MNSPVFSQKERNIIILLIVIALGAILVYATRGIYGAILGALVMYTLFRRLNIFFIEKWRWPKALSAVLIIVISIFIIVLPFAGIGGMLVKKAIRLQEDPTWLNQMIEAINNFAGDKLGNPDLLKEQIQQSAAFMGQLFTKILGGAADLFIEVTVMYFILYFLFVNHRGFEAGLTDYLPFNEKQATIFANEIKNITNSNIIGQTVIAIVQGGCLAIGFWIFGVRDALFWGVICAILSFIPLLGPPLIFVPAALILFSQGQTWPGVGLLIWGFGLVINIDNVLRFIINKKVGDIHPLITVVGVIIGLPLFGLIGLVYGPLLLAYFLIAVKIYKENKRLSLRKAQLEENQ